MQLTNKLNYPAPIYEAVKANIYKPREKTMRVTEIINPPLIKTLQLRYWDDIVCDVDDFIDTTIGTACHTMWEQHTYNALKELRLTITEGGHDVTGQIDFYDPKTGLMRDYKHVSAFSFTLGAKPEWEAQLNLYCLLLRKYQLNPTTAEICAVLKDWSRYDAMRDSRYPQQKVFQPQIPLWDYETQVAFLMDRLKDHIENPERMCTPVEMWERPTQYAVKKEGVQKAVKVKGLNSLAEAEAYAKELKGKHYVETRPGSRVRCENYCQARSVCPYAKKYIETKKDNELFGETE